MKVRLFMVAEGGSIGFPLEERSGWKGLAGGRSIGFPLEEWKSCGIDAGQRFHVSRYMCCHLIFGKISPVLSLLVYSLRKDKCVAIS